MQVVRNNKILCYSRTTSFLFENLPHEFFDFESGKNKFKELKLVFPELNDGDISSLCVMQVFHSTTGNSIVKNIKKFLLSDSYAVMLFLVNMEHVSKDSVNFIRFAIDEAEFSNKQSDKHFILLLHFPAENFFLHCYPSYFQDEWDLCYLDSTAPAANGGTIDLKKCFLYAYQCSKTNQQFMDEVVESLLSKELLAFSVARINKILKRHDSSSMVANLLSTDKKNSIRRSLKRKFVQQWSPFKMMQTLQQAANSALSLDYTLNMTNAISTILKSNFYNFMVFVLTVLAKSGVLSILIENQASAECLDLIRAQIEGMDLPSSTQMKIQSSSITRMHDAHFPFFNDLYNTVEHVVKSYTGGKREVNVEECAKDLTMKIEESVSVQYKCF